MVPPQLTQSLSQFAQVEVGGLACAAIGVLIALVSLVAMIWAIVDIVKNPRLDSTEKLIWVLVVLILELLGVLIYVLVGRKKT